jgi:hypothetical protein
VSVNFAAERRQAVEKLRFIAARGGSGDNVSSAVCSGAVNANIYCHYTRRNEQASFSSIVCDTSWRSIMAAWEQLSKMRHRRWSVIQVLREGA